MSSRLTILHLGDDRPGTTTEHRRRALERMGHVVTSMNVEERMRAANIWIQRFHYRTGFGVYSHRVARDVLRKTEGRRFDLCWVDGGSCINRRLLRALRGKVSKIINYNPDDPPGGRDGARWCQLLLALDDYDLLVVPREPTAADYRSRTRTPVLRVSFSYDPVAHARVSLTPEEARRFACKVSFIGAWKPERGPFLMRLLQLGIPLVLRGNGWDKDPEWATLRRFWQPPVFNREYVAAMQASEVALGLLSVGNRDEHTQRSAEIPFIGTAFCAQRTSEHAAMYADGIQAVLWSTADECAERCNWLLENPERRARIADAGHQRVLELKISNDDVMANVLQMAYAPHPR